VATSSPTPMMGMRFFRLNLLLFLVFLVLVGGFFYHRNVNPHPMALSGPISEIVLTVSGQPLHIRNIEGRWQLDPPQNKPLDQEIIADLLIGANSLKSRRTFVASPEELRSFGLQSSMNMLTLRSDKSSVTMVYGRRTFDGADVYVRKLGHPEVFLVSTERVQRLLKRLSDLRDPYLFGLPSAEILDRIQIVSPGAPVVRLSRHGVFWVKDDSAKKSLQLVDKMALDQFLSALGSLKAQNFVGLSALKTETPVFEVTVYYGAIERKMSFFKVSGLLFVTLGTYPGEAFQILPEFEKQLMRSWVVERPFVMDRFDIDSVVLVQKTKNMTREFQKTQVKSWVCDGKDQTLWVHNFFVYLSALTQGAAVRDSGADAYVLFLRMGDLQSRLDIAMTGKKVDGDPILRIRLGDRTMFVRDPKGSFISHVLGVK
jgi:hypothetical protein